MTSGTGVEGSKGPSTTTTLPVAKPSAQMGKLARESFPDQPSNSSKQVPATLENFKHVIDAAKIGIRFNIIKKRPEIEVPGLNFGRQNRDAVVLSRIESLLIRNDMSPAQARQHLLVLADAHPFDPFADWVTSRAWDGRSRISEICETLIPADGYPAEFRDVLVRKWLLSIVAATFVKQGFRARGVLTLQGEQGLGKTSWIANLVTPAHLREEAVKLGHSWDGGSKDARLAAVRHRIVELGELEASFRREMAGLKAFITETEDKIRPPYARVEAEYPRSTIFAASVNERQFLSDTTGNSRFWTVRAAKIGYQHTIDMQQVFAELKIDLGAGAEWWLNDSEEKQLAEINNEHRLVSAIEARIQEELDLDRMSADGLPRLTAIEVLKVLGIEKPTNPQAKEANVALRALLGPHKRIGGYNRWPIPWRKKEATAAAYDPAQDEY